MSESQTTTKRKAASHWGWKESKEAFRASPKPIKFLFWFALVLGLFNCIVMFSPSEAAREYAYIVGPFSQYFIAFHAITFISGLGSKARWMTGWYLFIQLASYFALNLVNPENSIHAAAPWWPVQVLLLIGVFVGPLFLPGVTSYFNEVDAERARQKAEKLERYAKLPKWS